MKRLLITSLCVLFASTIAIAFPVQVISNDGPQDPLLVPPVVHELGTAPGFINFPDELIQAYDTPTDITVCFDPTTPDDPAIMNTLVVMTNMTRVSWAEVWYVAEPDETLHSNFDGWVGGMAGAAQGTAFRIDCRISDPMGIHHPLIAETMTVDGIFEPGETWEFVIQDYRNLLQKPASLLGSLGVPSMPSAPDQSSGSIIAIPVPEPATICMLSLGALALIRKRK